MRAGLLAVKPGVRELLEYLKSSSFRTAVASSTYTHIVEKELSDAGILPFFDRIVGGDQVSRSKPNPDIFLRAAEVLDTAPEACLVIEDSYNGIRAAKAAGMRAIMVPDLLQPDALSRRPDLSLPAARAGQPAVPVTVINWWNNWGNFDIVTPCTV
jgi:beta-phosphoglucomutase-like phosphatase (HAD superfamily)